MVGCTPQEVKTLTASLRRVTIYRISRAVSSLPAFAEHTAAIGASMGALGRAVSCWLTSQNTPGQFRVCELLTGAMFCRVCCTHAYYLLHLTSLHLRKTCKIWDSGVQVEFCKSRSTCLHLYMQPRQSTVMFGPDKIRRYKLQLWVLICMASCHARTSYCPRKCKCLVLYDVCCKSEIVVVISHEVPLRKNKIPLF